MILNRPDAHIPRVLKAFLEKIKGNSSVQEKLEVVRSPDDVAGIAKDHGREFAADKFSQLSEEELEGLAGGTVVITITIPVAVTLADNCMPKKP